LLLLLLLHADLGITLDDVPNFDCPLASVWDATTEFLQGKGVDGSFVPSFGSAARRGGQDGTEPREAQRRLLSHRGLLKENRSWGSSGAGRRYASFTRILVTYESSSILTAPTNAILLVRDDGQLQHTTRLDVLAYGNTNVFLKYGYYALHRGIGQ
jgi:hypothetical protein